jgi:hypothetical protein
MRTPHRPGSMNSFTLGRWTVERPYGEPGVYVSAYPPYKSNPLICWVYEADEGKQEANARLIAAAPDLLAACEAFVDAYGRSHQLEKTDKAERMARTAIEKALGIEL